MKVLVVLKTADDERENVSRADRLVHLRSEMARARAEFITVMQSIDPKVTFPEADEKQVVPIIELDVSDVIFAILNNAEKRPAIVKGVDRIDAGDPDDFQLAGSEEH